jgi:hypothetical protein
LGSKLLGLGSVTLFFRLPPLPPGKETSDRYYPNHGKRNYPVPSP